LLDALWAQTRFINHPWWENAAFIDLIGFDVTDDTSRPVRKVRTTEWEDGIFWLDEEWNSLYRLSQLSSPRIRHYSSVPNWKRARLIRQDLGLAPQPLSERIFDDAGRLRRRISSQVRAQVDRARR
jgi:hypothetical protein